MPPTSIHIRDLNIADLKLIAFCSSVALCIWLMMGFRSEITIMNSDAINSLLPMMYLLTEAEGDWAALSYSLEQFGGNNILGIYGVLPISILFANSGLSPLWNLNLTFLVLHLTFICLAISATRVWAGEREFNFDPRNLLVTCGLIFFLGFSPMLAVRIEVGHLNLFLGMLFIQAMLCLWLCHRNKQLSMPIFSLAIFALVHALCSPSFQILVYALVFASPFLVGFYFSATEREKLIQGAVSLLFCAVCVACAILIASPVFLELINFALGPDASRTLGQQQVLYNFMSHNLNDLWASVFWFDSDQLKRASYQHEVLFGLGPLLILVGYVLYRKAWLPLTGFLASLVLCIGFSLNLMPISGLLLELIPPLADFRVASRAILPVMIIWGCYGCAMLIPATKNLTLARKDFLIIALFISIILILPARFLDPALWLILGLTLYGLAKGKQVALAGLIIVCLSSLIAFDRKLSLAPITQMLASTSKLGQSVRNTKPDLALPLNRVALDILDLGLLVPVIGKINTLNSYGFPVSRFSKWSQLVMGVEYDPTRTYFNIMANEPGFDTLQQLYNICCQITNLDGEMILEQLPETAGPIWASSHQQIHENDLLMAQFLAQSTKTNSWAKVQHVTEKSTQGALNQNCLQLEFSQPMSHFHGQLISVALSQPSMGACPVSISMTYASNLNILVKKSDQFEATPHFPAYGSLVGFTMPHGTTDILIQSTRTAYPMSYFLLILGLILFFSLTYNLSRLQK